MKLCMSVLVVLALMACSSDEPADIPEDTAKAEDSQAPEDALQLSGDVEEQMTLEAHPCLNAGTPGATATCLQPTQTVAYYAEQANKYFDQLDIDADPESVPNYHELVGRWEWPPWLLLTGYTAEDMIKTSIILKDFDPSTVPVRDCRGFDTQPFARCYVVFEYEEGPCPIYEEFTFNNAGEMTFIEAWSDLPGLRPHPDGVEDKWGERNTLGRLSTRVPGLGSINGTVDLTSEWILEASKTDADVAEYAKRAADWWTFWLEELNSADKDFFGQGCGW